MGERIALLPLDFENGAPKDRALFDAVQAFCQAEFGVRPDFSRNGKTWAAVKIDEQLNGYEVIGVASLAFALDCPVFHVQKPSTGPGHEAESREEARAVRDKLMERASAFLQDNYGPGTQIFVHVAPEAERFWKGYLRMIGAESANRWIVKV